MGASADASAGAVRNGVSNEIHWVHQNVRMRLRMRVRMRIHWVRRVRKKSFVLRISKASIDALEIVIFSLFHKGCPYIFYSRRKFWGWGEGAITRIAPLAPPLSTSRK